MNAQVKPPAAREVLRAAIAGRNEAATRVREAAAALARATQLACEAKGREIALGNVDGAILAHATAAYRTFAENGGERPVVDTPPHLAERREARNAARRELDAAQAAQAELAAEHEDAQREHERRDRAVATAARGVLVAEGARIAAEIGELVARLLPLHDELAALAQVSAPQLGQTWAQGQLQLTQATLDRITTPLAWRPDLPGGQNYVSPHVGPWQRLLEALRTNAEAAR